MMAPRNEPIGLQVTRTAKLVARAFDGALAQAGGSLPEWLVLASLKSQHHGMQRDLADAVGVEGPTLTHHLNRMEDDGLVRRTRDPDNRRAHLVELTDEGEATFHRWLGAVVAFDHRLRTGLRDEDVGALSDLLARLRVNVSDPTITEERTGG